MATDLPGEGDIGVSAENLELVHWRTLADFLEKL
jgi:hypothetical protein